MRKITILILSIISISLLNVQDVKAEVVPFKQPKINVSNEFTAVEGSNALKIVESTKTQTAIIEKFENGARYGMSQKGYTPNPIIEGVSAAYAGYEALYCLYGDDPDYQAYIRGFQEMDTTFWGQEYVGVNVIIGTFMYGEERLDAIIDAKTGEILESVITFQNGFEETVNKCISKVENNVYSPGVPAFEYDVYGLTSLSNIASYTYVVPSGANYYTACISWFDNNVMDLVPADNFVCFLKQRYDLYGCVERQLVVVTKEPIINGYACGKTITETDTNIFQSYIPYSDNTIETAPFTLVAHKGEYYIYTTGIIFTVKDNVDFYDYYYPYLQLNISLGEFVDYYVDNAGELSVGGVLLTPVEPSTAAFPQPGNVYNPSDLSEYIKKQDEKIEECPILIPEKEPYPGSLPTPGIEPENKNAVLPDIVINPETGAMTVEPGNNAVTDDNNVNNPSTDETDSNDLGLYQFDLSKKFPFCVPFDLIKSIKILKKEPVAPSIEWTLKVDMIDFEYTFSINLEKFDSVAKISRTLTTLSFIIALIVATRNLIRG